jgi:signal transduction histidine kinase
MRKILLFISLSCFSSSLLLGQNPLKAKIDSIGDLSYSQLTANPEKSIASLLFYLDQAQKSNYKHGVAKLSSHLGLSYYILGKYEKSTEYRLKAINIYENLNDKTSVGNEYCALGYEMKRRDLVKAFQYMRLGLKIFANSNNQSALGHNYNNYGVLYEMRGDIDSAIYYYKASIATKKKNNDLVGISYSLNNIFQAMLINKQADAISYLDSSTRIREKLNDEFAIIENYVSYGDYYFVFKQYEKACKYFELVLNRSQGKYIYLVQYSSKFLAESLEALGKPAEAIKYFKVYIQFKDSLTNVETNKSIASMEIQFETEKKEKEIALQKARLAQVALEVKQRNYLLFALAFVIIFIISGGLYIYKQQKFKQEKLLQEALLKDQIANITLTNKLQEERLRISRDLHDNIGSQLTFIISALDNVSFLLKNADEAVAKRIKQINLFTTDTISQLRDTIWAMNKEHITSEDLKSRIINYISRLDLPQAPTINFNDNLSPEIAYKSIQGMNIFRVIQEATNNALKHAKASEINIHLSENSNHLFVTIADDGMGYDGSLQGNNGLINMKKRIEEINGELKIESNPGKGTKVLFSAPFEYRA